MNRATLVAMVVAFSFVGLDSSALAQTPPAAEATAATASAGWERISQLSPRQVVRVRLNDGRVLSGTVRQLGQNVVQFAETRQLTKIEMRDVTLTFRSEDGDLAPDLHRLGQSLRLRLRDGREVQGTIERRDRESVWLAQPNEVQSLPRETLVRVTRKSRWRGALIGLGVGAALGAYLVTHDGDSLGPGETMTKLAVGGATAFGLIGAGIGAAIGTTVTLYTGHGKP